MRQADPGAPLASLAFRFNPSLTVWSSRPQWVRTDTHTHNNNSAATDGLVSSCSLVDSRIPSSIYTPVLMLHRSSSPAKIFHQRPSESTAHHNSLLWVISLFERGRWEGSLGKSPALSHTSLPFPSTLCYCILITAGWSSYQ